MLAQRGILLLGALCWFGACQPTAPAREARTRDHLPPAAASVPPVPRVEREPAPAPINRAATPFPAIASASLKNGMLLDVIERHAIPVVQLSLVVAAGHARDADHPGVARVMAQLLEAGGAGRWSSTKLREAVDALGSSLEIASTRDSLRWSLAVTSDKVPEALQILGALAQKPRFDPTEFSKLKDRELERVRSLAKTSGSWLAQYWLHRELYQQPIGIHPYASVDVLPSELERLRLEDCRSFWRTQLVPSNARIIAVGDVDLTALTRLVEQAFGGWSGKPPQPLGLSEPNPPGQLRLIVVDRPGSAQSDVLLGLPGPSRRSGDFPTIMTIQQILGGGVAGRLFLDVREKRSLAYATYAGIQEVAFGPSVLTLSAGTQTAKTSETVAALLEHLDRLTVDPGSLEELETAQRYIVHGLPARWETVESLSNQLLLLRTLGQPDRYFDELREQISSLSTPVLKDPASRYYQHNRAALVVAGDADRIAEGLRRFGPVEVLNPEREFSIKRKLPAL
jgi:zinc protease